jgi:hypothetical protein
MNDQELITAVRQSVHGVHMNVPAEQIVSRSRAIRAGGHRRLAAGITAAAAAGAVVLGLGLSGALGSAAAHKTEALGSTTAHGKTGTIRTAAFTLTRNANGTDTLTINPQVLLDPSTLQDDLTQYGIAAKVTIGSFCSSDPSPAGFRQVVTFYPSSGLISPAQHPTVTIDPAAMPAGTELSFGNFQLADGQETALTLIDTNSYTCASTSPTIAQHVQGVVVFGRGGPGN